MSAIAQAIRAALGKVETPEAAHAFAVAGHAEHFAKHGTALQDWWPVGSRENRAPMRWRGVELHAEKLNIAATYHPHLDSATLSIQQGPHLYVRTRTEALLAVAILSLANGSVTPSELEGAA